MNLMHLRGGAVVAVLMAMLGAGRVMGQDTLYDAGGFELPRFVAEMDVTGQDDGLLGQGPWVQDDGTSTATVQTNTVAGGLQSVRVERDGTATGDTRWGVVAPFSPTTAAHVVTIDVDMNVLVAASDLDPATPDLGPMFGVEAYGDAGGISSILGGLAIDASTGELLYREARTGNWAGSGTFYARNTYHHCTLALDFKAKTYTVSVDGTAVVTERLVSRKVTKFTDAPIFTGASASATETGTAYFDNYAITTTADPTDTNLVPLPLTSSWTPMGAMGAILLLGGRRFRRARANGGTHKPAV